MDNFFPSKYEEISNNLDEQWNDWRNINGNTVYIYDSKDECLKEWWSRNSGMKIKKKSKAVYNGKLYKDLFMSAPDKHCILFTQEPYEYFELTEDRNQQWLKYKKYNGLRVQLFKNINDCIVDRSHIV